MNSTPARVNITVVAGNTWRETIVFRDKAGAPVLFPDHDATLQIRTFTGMYGTTDDETLLVEAITGDEISWVSDSEIAILLPPESTQTLNPTNARALNHSWGLLLEDRVTGNRFAVMEGSVKVLGRVVR